MIDRPSTFLERLVCVMDHVPREGELVSLIQNEGDAVAEYGRVYRVTTHLTQTHEGNAVEEMPTVHVRINSAS